jgi:cell division inhibitor SepF
MGALRKAGVWLGLVEDEEDRHGDGLFDDEFAEDDDFEAAPARPRSLARPPQRGPEPRRDDHRDLRRDEHRREDFRREPREDLRRDEIRREDLRDQYRDRDSRSERELRELRELRAHRDLGDRVTTERGVRGSELSDPRAATIEPEPRAAVRPLARPGTPVSPAPVSSPATLSYPTQDNLALAPQVQLRERAVVPDERDRSRRPQITTLHPTSYSEARAIGEQFRDGHPVIMNLTEMDEPDAKRLVDFAAGLAFGLRGGMERVTNRVFLLSPPNVQVSAEDKARIAEAGFFDQS